MKSGSSAPISSHGQSAEHGLGNFVVIDITAALHVDGGVGALDDDDRGHAADFVAGCIHVCLERNLSTSTDALVGGDDAGRFAVFDTSGNRIGREAAEDHGMNRADTGAGEDRDRRLRDHRHVDGDAVAFLDAARLQHVGEAADLGMQLLVGKLLVVLGIVTFPDDCGLVTALGDMAVDAVVAGVERSILEPFDRDIVRVVGGVLDLAERLDPVDAPGLLGPEAVRVLDRTGIHFLVFGVVDEGAFAPFDRHIVDFLGHQYFLPPAVNARGLRCISLLGLLCDAARTPHKARNVPFLAEFRRPTRRGSRR